MIFFDFDGTLADSNRVWERVDVEFLGRRGLEPTAEYSHTVAHCIFPQAAAYTREYYGLSMSDRAIMDEWTELAREAYARQVPLKPGARAFLEQCARQGERMALLTACLPDLCAAALARHGIGGFFEDCVFVQELGMDKRQPETFRLAARRLGVEPEGCTLFEDSPGACAAAREAGLTVVGVLDPFYAPYEGELRAVCHRVIGSFAQLLEGNQPLTPW